MAGVQAVERAINLLRALADGPVPLTELAGRTGLARSTAARLLTTLEGLDMVERCDEGGAWQLGPGAAALGAPTHLHERIVACARFFLEKLRDGLGETAGVAVLDGDRVLYLDHAPASSDVQIRDWSGEHAPAHLVPSGLVHMARWPEGRLGRYLSGELGAPTAASVTEPGAILARLTRILSSGYEWCHGELVPGISSVAAPVATREGEIVAALHVHGPSYRFPDWERTHDIGRTVRDAAVELGTVLSP